MEFSASLPKHVSFYRSKLVLTWMLDPQQGRCQKQGLQQWLMLMMTWLNPNSLKLKFILACYVDMYFVFELYLGTLLDWG